MLRRSAVLTAILAVVVAACGTTAPALTDPNEILTKSALALKDVKTIHLQLDVTGKVSLDLSGTGSASQLDLAGTTATLDIDVAGQKVKATGLAPALFNSGGELIVADGSIYYKIRGPFAQGGKYTKLSIPATPGFSPAPGTSLAASLNPQVAIDELNKALAKLPSPPTRLADEKCGDADCYHISIHLSAEDIARLSSPMPMTSPGTADVTIDVWARKNDLRPAKMSFVVNAGAQGTVNVTIAATYDAALSIAAPPADQVGEGTGLPFPMPSLGP